MTDKQKKLAMGFGAIILIALVVYMIQCGMGTPDAETPAEESPQEQSSEVAPVADPVTQPAALGVEDVVPAEDAPGAVE